MNDVLFYFADKLLDFELAILLIVIGYYINKWLDGRTSPMQSSMGLFKSLSLILSAFQEVST